MSIPSHPPLFLRFTHKSPQDLTAFMQLLNSYKQNFITCLEMGERHHTHSYMDFHTTIDAFRKRLKKLFPGYSGNSDYSLVTVENKSDDILKVQRYICKGNSNQYEIYSNPNIVDMFGIDWDIIEQRHREYWSHNETITAENTQKKEKKERKKQMTWTQEVISEFYEKNPNLQLDYDNVGHKRAVFEFVLKRYGTCDKGFDSQIIKKACNAVWNKIAPSNFVDSIYRQTYPEDAQVFETYLRV